MEALHAHLASVLTDTAQQFVRDIEALSQEAFEEAAAPGRGAVDFTYEVAYVNDRLATRMSGGDPGPWPFDTWVAAPEEFRSKAAAIARLEESVNALAAAWEASKDDMHREIETPSGPTSPFKLMGFAQYHLAYHDGQLNYIQLIHGDTEAHWS